MIDYELNVVESCFNRFGFEDFVFLCDLRFSVSIQEHGVDRHQVGCRSTPVGQFDCAC